MKNEVFNKEYDYIKDERIRDNAKKLVNFLPDYFFEIPASSTGKYHPEFSLGNQGLVRHTKAAVRIAYELFNDEALQKFSSSEKDLIVLSLLIHDGVKKGKNENKYTALEHPLLICNLIDEKVKDLTLTSEEISLLKSMISSHMGPWNKDFDGNEILPYPKSKYQRFVHMCDYLASRRFLNIKFINNEIE